MIYELRLLLRTRLILWSALTMAAVVYLSLWLGWSTIEKQREQIASALDLQTHQRAEYLREHGEALPGAGDVAYYTFHAIPAPPGPMAWLSLEDREQRPAVQRIRMLGLQSQLYDGEAHNPEHASIGSLDFGFVSVFLLPLLCVCLCHDLASQDRERGRSGLMVSLIDSAPRFWLRRIAARYLLAVVAVLLPLAAFVVSYGAWRGELAILAAGVFVYAGVWVCVCAWIGLRWRARSSAANAMRMLAVWVIVVIVMPAFANSLIALRAPSPESGEIALAHRKKLNDAWDISKEATFEEFFRWHPEWRGTPPVETRFHWKWYYAFHHVADRHVEPMARASEEAMRARASHSASLGLALPSVAMQTLIDWLADNGIESLIAHRRAVREFHDRLRLYFYPFVFDEKTFRPADFVGMPTPKPSGAKVRSAPLSWVGLFGFLMLSAFGLRREFVPPAFAD